MLINEQSIYHFFGEDEEMMHQMLQIIINTNLKELKQLETLFQNEDYKMVKKKCHKSKPSMSYIGAIKTKKILEEIEADVLGSYPKKFQELDDHIQTIERELNEFMGTRLS
ncbi:Hpt domain-containing protein [Pararhodonellum marinum]|uniref:Hpt domain-containing protein n=1 Tax=Pararhodonellum marinum TaxID=2755358 RepID=UPI001E621268|nr:Hpt domain-containing protein [Pararhodonellum marinum]